MFALLGSVQRCFVIHEIIKKPKLSIKPGQGSPPPLTTTTTEMAPVDPVDCSDGTTRFYPGPDMLRKILPLTRGNANYVRVLRRTF